MIRVSGYKTRFAMSAHSMTGHYQLMMLPISTMQNLDRALKGANIGVEKMVVSNLATAEASLLKDEKEYGVCLVDIGAGNDQYCGLFRWAFGLSTHFATWW